MALVRIANHPMESQTHTFVIASDGPDYSYGLYIFAYPVQQTLIWATGMTSAPLHIAASLVVTLGIAALSWHFVEEPALRLKERLRTRIAKAPNPRPAATASAPASE